MQHHLNYPWYYKVILISMTDLINRRTGKTAQLHRSKKFELIFVCKVVYLRFGYYIEPS